MSKVNITVNNKPFTIACDDGQESRVEQLGAYVDARFKELNSAGAAPNESYTLVLTALVIADDMFEAKDQAEKARMEASRAVSQAPQGPSPAEIEAKIRAELSAAYDNHINGLNAEISRLRDAARKAQSNVTDITQARAEAEAAMKAKEAEIALAVDALSDKLENVVKKLKRA
jgi:cell division protein ZapA